MFVFLFQYHKYDMLNVQTNVEATGFQVKTSQGCGCGKAVTTTTMASALTPQQISVLEAVQRISKRRNATYKTQTRLFM